MSDARDPRPAVSRQGGLVSLFKGVSWVFTAVGLLLLAHASVTTWKGFRASRSSDKVAVEATITGVTVESFWGRYRNGVDLGRYVYMSWFPHPAFEFIDASGRTRRGHDFCWFFTSIYEEGEVVEVHVDRDLLERADEDGELKGWISGFRIRYGAALATFALGAFVALMSWVGRLVLTAP